MLPRPNFADDQGSIPQSQPWSGDEDDIIDESGGFGAASRLKRSVAHVWGEDASDREREEEEGSQDMDGEEDAIEFPDRVDLNWYFAQYGIKIEDAITLARNWANYHAKQIKAPRRLNPN